MRLDLLWNICDCDINLHGKFLRFHVPIGTIFSWIYWMFYDNISAFCSHTHQSLLAKLGRWGLLMRMMRLAWKQSQKTLDTAKRLHRNKTRITGSAGKGFDSQLCQVQVRHAWRHLAGRWNHGQVAPTTGSLMLVPPRSKEEVFKVFEPKRVDSLLLPW